MSVKYKYDDLNNIIHVFPEKNLTLNLIEEYFNTILNDDKIKSEFVELVHFDIVTNFNYDSNVVIYLKSVLENLLIKKQPKGAIILAETDLQFGMARMFEMIMEGTYSIIAVKTKDNAVSEINKLLLDKNLTHSDIFSTTS